MLRQGLPAVCLLHLSRAPKVTKVFWSHGKPEPDDSSSDVAAKPELDDTNSSDDSSSDVAAKPEPDDLSSDVAAKPEPEGCMVP